MINQPTIETDTPRIRHINSVAEELDLPVRLVSIQYVFHRNVSPDQETNHIGEIHTVEVNGTRTEVPIWFRGSRVLRVG
jgi:hypothetical protein